VRDHACGLPGSVGVQAAEREVEQAIAELEPATGRWLYHIVEHATSVAFIEFLEQILDAYPKAPVIAIVLDNVSTHSSRAVDRWPFNTPWLPPGYGQKLWKAA
jgi:hypothetical protein